MIHFIQILILGFNLFVVIADSASNRIAELRGSSDFLSISLHVFYVSDSTHSWTIETVQDSALQKQFIQNDQLTLKFFDKIEHTYWMKLDVRNKRVSSDWIIEIPYSKIAFLDWYINENGKWIEYRDGFETAESERFLISFSGNAC